MWYSLCCGVCVWEGAGGSTRGCAGCIVWPLQEGKTCGISPWDSVCMFKNSGYMYSLWEDAHQLPWFTDPSLLQVLDYAIEADQLVDKYESLASELLQWIEQTIGTLNDRQLANSLNAVQNQLQAFNSYRTVEKPPKWVTEGWVKINTMNDNLLVIQYNPKCVVPKC